MAEANPSPSTTTVTDVDVDSLAHCATYLSLQDLSNMGMSCKYLKRVAYSDSIWSHWFREHWPQQMPSASLQTLELREAYLARRTALKQIKFVDPLVADFYTVPRPYKQILLDGNDVVFSQGSSIGILKSDGLLSGRYPLTSLSDHNARITCMRLFSLTETSLFRNETQSKENVLVTSSCDRSIRLWWKGSCQRCFRGHNGPVSALSDKLLGDGSSKVLASGGEDGTVRLWSLNSSGKRGQHALTATLYGHEKPVKLMSVSGHRTSLLVTISSDSKVRVWDTNTSSAEHISCCVGMTAVPGAPVNIKCHESMLYVAAGSSVIAIDLRTMQKVFTAATCQPKLYSFEIMPSKSLICTGGNGRAMLWDIRRNLETTKPEPIAELDGHTGPVTFLHMDQYKIVTGGPEDSFINVWETDNGSQTNSLICGPPDRASGCHALAVNGYRIVTASLGEEQGVLRFRDFTNASCPVAKPEDEHASKFWDTQSYSDTDGSDC
ncbi:probable E3 ubiquitin ligase complex SCF subunit sconB [Corylus avellana]|uniref:probable E3 ubiquitin ligase complex SCF subunit sconB n=1 Tax=Corylus avellana TaxID=13451 RepID=UPI001E226148|nr:probable E3 ubiquitin ligase complex SCF subunit sconB [Corylus avellana]